LQLESTQMIVRIKKTKLTHKNVKHMLKKIIVIT